MCGIVGIIGTSEAAREAFLSLTTLQHRGQDAAGILSYDASGFHLVKNIGLVESVFTRENMASLTGDVAIGHARYSTIGRGDVLDVQPLLLSYPFGLGMAHNGNIVNCGELGKDLLSRGRRHLMTRSDTEVILNLFAEGLAVSPAGNGQTDLEFEHICSAVKTIFKRVNGSYSIVTLVADQGLVAFRDPAGIRPLVLGKKQVAPSSASPGATEMHRSSTAYIVASESVALSFLGYELVRDIQPGEVLWIDKLGQVHSSVLAFQDFRHCMFEWVYFASPESIIDGVSVYGARIQLGKHLARLIKKQIDERKIEADIIVPVPETSRIAAIALAEELAIPYREVLIKNRYIKRTFILDSQEKRQKAVNLKLSPVRSEIEGKKVILVDDSIVRGTTSKKIIDLVRQAGATKIYFVSTCPPIRYPCYYGIDFPVQAELIASGRDLKQIEQELGADAVIYQNQEGLQDSIRILAAAATLTARAGMARADAAESYIPCMACLDGMYPTDISSGRGFADIRSTDRTG